MVVWARQAQQDLLEVEDYYGELVPDLAKQLQDRVGEAAAFLGSHPFAGPLLRHGPARKWNVRRSPYVLVYRVERDAIRILRVRHERSDWG